MAAALVVAGVVCMILAVVIAKRRWPDRRTAVYGGTFAFLFHVTAIFGAGLLLVLLLLASAPLNAVVLTMIALGLGDIAVGALSRRRLRRRVGP
jgi:amino acid transporter